MYNQNDIEKLFDFYDKNDKTKMICLDINLMCFNFTENCPYILSYCTITCYKLGM